MNTYNRRRSAILFFLLFLTSLFLNCTSSTASCNGCSPYKKLSPRVIFIDPSGQKKVVVHVELACTEREHTVGLMYRKKLDENSGMLFIFSYPKIQRFWMKNTYIPLDMVHLDEHKKIVGYIENAQPHDLSTQSVGKPAQYVLEVNAFFMRKHQIHRGWTVKFVDIPSC